MRANNCEELIAIIDRAISTRTLGEWLSECSKRGLISAPVNRVQDIANDVQVTTNKYIVDIDHEALGETKMIGFPVKFSNLQLEVKTGAPELGQHTEEVLLESGYSWDDINNLRLKGAI